MSYPSSADVLARAAELPPAGSLAIHLDLVGGLSGDMFVAAMVDALPALAPIVLAEVEKVRGPNERAASSERIGASSAGSASTRAATNMSPAMPPTRSRWMCRMDVP